MLLGGKADIVVLVNSLIPLVRYPGISVHFLRQGHRLLWLSLLDDLLFLVKFVLDLLDLILEDLELALLILKLLRVDIHLVLQALCLALVHRVITTAHAAPRNRCLHSNFYITYPLGF